MTPTDLATVHAACFTTPRPWRTEEFEDFLSDKKCDLAALPGGFALIRSIADETELLTIAVAPARRRQGIATRLLHQAIAQARSRGSCKLFLEVATTNKAAIALYQIAGFTLSGYRPRYYTCPDGTRCDAALMALNL